MSIRNAFITFGHKLLAFENTIKIKLIVLFPFSLHVNRQNRYFQLLAPLFFQPTREEVK